jgi:RNA polymerase sigma factor (sigma-70 family)
MNEAQASREGDPRDTETVLALFHSYLPCVAVAARARLRRLRPGVVSLEDLVAFGREALLGAARSYDPSTATVEFGTWAAPRIRSAMIDGIRRFALPRRAWKRVANGDGGYDVVLWGRGAWPQPDVEDTPGPEEAFAHAEILARLREAVGRLSGHERTLIDRHYLSDEPLAKTAASMGLSGSWARRLRMSALARLAAEASAWA